MAGIACASSSGLIFNGSKESSARNGAPMFQYNGLKAVETIQMGSTKFEAKGFISTSGTCEYDHAL